MSRFLPFFVILLLVACQPLTQPFGGDRPPPMSPITSPPDSVGIVVAPVANAPPKAASALADAMAAALREQDVPADTKVGNQKSYRLAGKAEAKPQGDHVLIVIDWELLGPDGHSLGHQNSSGDAPAADWRDGNPYLAKDLAAKIAPALARSVEGDVPVEAKISNPVVAVRMTPGAPGDGEKSLTRQIAEALRHAGVTVKVKPDEKENFVLVGAVTIAPPDAGQQKVKVTWSLARTDGSQIGEVSQENAVPAGTLDGPWGDVAYAVASAAAGGIIELIERAKTAEAHS